LEAVLKDARGQYDRIVCLGDIVCYGADPNFVVDWARAKVSAIVRGNLDAVYAGLESLSRFNDNAAAAAAWSQHVLSPKNLAYLKRLPPGPLSHEGFDLTHGSPLGEYDYLCSKDDVAAISDRMTKPLTFFGHTHQQGGFEIKPNGKINVIDPADMIEDSILNQLRTTLRDSGTREQLNVSEALWQSFELDHGPLVRAVVKDVSYDGTTGAVSLNLTRSRDTHED
jgi:predicted phosphodiesterase